MSNRNEEFSSETSQPKAPELEYDKQGLPRLTPQEEAVLRECRKNALYYRGIPLGIISVLITRRAATASPHIHRFRVFYYVGAFGLSLLSGIASYRRQCMAKILQLENSPLADRLREQLKGHSPYQRLHQWQQHQQQQNERNSVQEGGHALGRGFSRSPQTSSTETSTDSYQNDDQIPAFRSKPVEDYKLGTVADSRSTEATPAAMWDEDEKPDRRQQVSYSDLRQQNRRRWSESEERKQLASRLSENRNTNNSESTLQGKQEGFRKPTKTNIYGDLIEE